MGRGKTELKRIESSTSRRVTFSKRRNGLLKKAFEISVLCDIEVGVIVFFPQGNVYDFASSSMQNVIERYKMNLVDLSSNSGAAEQNIQHEKCHRAIYLVDLSSNSSASEQNIQLWKQEAALNAMKIDFLEASNRKLMGENLESCSLEDLNKLEGQLEQGLGNIRGIKNWLLSGKVTQLEEKTRVLSEENKLLQNQVALQDNNNQHNDVDTDLYIGCPGRGKI